MAVTALEIQLLFSNRRMTVSGRSMAFSGSTKLAWINQPQEEAQAAAKSAGHANDKDRLKGHTKPIQKNHSP
ncbi:hypothetical protein [Paracoccus alkanivorans]|uniref:hypothetical protein n=1 Tax=Paracoccus alkanivorans TaxID=2116655 RepID=UPI0011C38E49|nr:hypothetical protein [Paracoccus alkanivorans]